MEYANQLTKEQIKNFIEQAFNVKVKRIVLKNQHTNMAECFLKIKGFENVYFIFNDFTFNFPYSKFGLIEQSVQIRKQWYNFMANIFGEYYVTKLNQHLDAEIEIQKTLTKHKLEHIESKHASAISALQTKIDLLNSAIKQADARKIEDLKAEEELLKKQIIELNNYKIAHQLQQEK